MRVRILSDSLDFYSPNAFIVATGLYVRVYEIAIEIHMCLICV